MGWRAMKKTRVSSSCGGQTVIWKRRKVPSAAETTPTPSRYESSVARFRARESGDPGGTRPGRVPEAAALPASISSRKPGLSFDADLRIQVSEWTHLRAVPADERPAAVRAPDLRREPAREGPLPGGNSFQGVRLLLDRLRAWRARARRRQAGKGGLVREEGEVGLEAREVREETRGSLGFRGLRRGPQL